MEERPRAPGRVILVGAGPGDPGLITVRGLEALRRADAVLYDRLIPRALLDEAPPAAERLDVSKTPGGPAVEQAAIHALLIDRARRGQTVVRLKGGDPFVVGRGGEEVLACRAAGVAVEVIPGVSSAFAAPAAAGIPVTHRGLARTVMILTGAAESAPGEEGAGAEARADSDLRAGADDAGAQGAARAEEPPIDWRAAARADTVVILMGRARLETIARRLIEAGAPPDRPAACVASAWTPEQRVVMAPLGEIAARAAAVGLRAPVVTIVGEVCGLGRDGFLAGSED